MPGIRREQNITRRTMSLLTLPSKLCSSCFQILIDLLPTSPADNEILDGVPELGKHFKLAPERNQRNSRKKRKSGGGGFWRSCRKCFSKVMTLNRCAQILYCLFLLVLFYKRVSVHWFLYLQEILFVKLYSTFYLSLRESVTFRAFCCCGKKISFKSVKQ